MPQEKLLCQTVTAIEETTPISISRISTLCVESDNYHRLSSLFHYKSSAWLIQWKSKFNIESRGADKPSQRLAIRLDREM